MIVCEPSVYAVVFSGSVQLLVPVAGCGVAPSTDTLTVETALLSAAVPATVTVPAATDPDEGAEMATTGGAVSQGFLLVQLGPPGALARAGPATRVSEMATDARNNHDVVDFQRLRAAVRCAAASRRAPTDIVAPFL